jgi:hypothetical protein
MSRRTQRIRELEAEADQHEGKSRSLRHEAEDMARESDRLRWQAARLIAEEIAAGRSLRDLGKDIGKSHTHVRRMAAMWDLCGVNQVYTKVPFNKLYRTILYTKPPSKPLPMQQEIREAIGVSENLIKALDHYIEWLRNPEHDTVAAKQTWPSVRSRLRLLAKLMGRSGVAEDDGVLETWRTSRMVATGERAGLLRVVRSGERRRKTGAA